MTELESDLSDLLNKHSQDNLTQTPDFLLAKFLLGCIKVYSTAIAEREKWFGRGGEQPGTDCRLE